MGQFDQTARPLAKEDGSAFFGWALGVCAGVHRLTFVRWDDTRRLVVPGEPDRTNDLVALFRDEDSGGEVWLITEIESEPEPGMLYRMGQYEIVLGKEVNPTCDPAGPAIGSLVLNLSGTQTHPRVEWTWGGYGTRLAPFVIDVARLDATAHLDRIERGELGLTVSPFLALMIGGGTPGFVKDWREVVEKKGEPERLARYREAAFVFAELTAFQVNWIRGLEDWAMPKESQYIKGWEKVGEDRADLRKTRLHLLKLVRLLEDPVPESIRMAVEGTTDVDKLEQWFDAASTANSIVDLRRAMQLEP